MLLSQTQTTLIRWACFISIGHLLWISAQSASRRCTTELRSTLTSIRPGEHGAAIRLQGHSSALYWRQDTLPRMHAMELGELMEQTKQTLG